MIEIIKKSERPKSVVEINNFIGNPANIYIAVDKRSKKIYKLSYYCKYYWRPLYRTDSGSLFISEETSLETIISNTVAKDDLRVYEFESIKGFAEWLVEAVK